MMLVIEYLNVLTQGEWQKRLAGKRWKQYILCAALGATPGCLGAFAVVAMFSQRRATLGAGDPGCRLAGRSFRSRHGSGALPGGTSLEARCKGTRTTHIRLDVRVIAPGGAGSCPSRPGRSHTIQQMGHACNRGPGWHDCRQCVNGGGNVTYPTHLRLSAGRPSRAQAYVKVANALSLF